MKLTVAALMFLVLLEFAYCAPYLQLQQGRPQVYYADTGAPHAQQYARHGGQPIYTNTGAPYAQPQQGNPWMYYPNIGAQWPQLNWENSQPNYTNQNKDRMDTSKSSGPNIGFGFNVLKGLVDINARASLNDQYTSTNEHFSNTNVIQPEPTFINPFGN